MFDHPLLHIGLYLNLLESDTQQIEPLGTSYCLFCGTSRHTPDELGHCPVQDNSELGNSEKVGRLGIRR